MKAVLTAAVAGAVILFATRGPAQASAAVLGDVNGDCVVSTADIAIVAAHYGAFYGSLLYSPAYDFNHDHRIGITDIQTVAQSYGAHC